MLKDFESDFAKNAAFNKKQKFLLALSGGIDSVVLAHLMRKSGFTFALAHCNFRLRGRESNADEKFCRQLAKELGVEIFVKTFNTKDHIKTHKTSVQIAARELRYEWFGELLKKKGFDLVLTAHHTNDSLETLLINLLRGTGIKGLRGIPEKQGLTVRPLLNFTRAEIDAYAKGKNINYRSDTSNEDDKYARNFLRLNVIPLLRKINPTLENTFKRNIANFRQEADIVTDYLEERAADLITQTHDYIFIDKRKLKREKYQQSVINHLIGGYGFNDTSQKNILRSITEDGISGKRFTSTTHALCVDRHDLVIKPLSGKSIAEITFRSFADLKKQNDLKVSDVKKFAVPMQNEFIVKKSRLVFPMILRKKATGDKFRPFGMKGFKLLSDFLKDEKLNAFEKESCRVLENGNGDILWVAGYRSDDRYKVTPTDTGLIKLTLLE